MIRIVHVITSLDSGGAENMLYKLLKYSDKEKYYHEVISLKDKGVIGKKIEDEGIKVHSLHIKLGNICSSICNARKICNNFEIINSWLYHADIFSFIISKLLLKKKLIWNIRHSNLNKNVNKRRTLLIIKINSLLSKYVDIITFNSIKAKETHWKKGYRSKNFKIIPNGFELDRYNYDREKRKEIRDSLLFTNKDKVLITVGRWDIQKDYDTLLKALKELDKQNIDFRMLMVGTNLDLNNGELRELLDKYQLHKKIILFGKSENVSELLSAADIYISSSLGESFSNAIGEAMACELPCIVTDVGDSKIIVGHTGVVVEARDYISLAREIKKKISLDSISRCKEARKRIEENYEISVVAKQIEKIFLEIK